MTTSEEPMDVSKQCKATWSTRDGRTLEYGCHTFSCVRREGHEGQHFDHYGRWNEEIVVSLEVAQRELGVRP